MILVSTIKALTTKNITIKYNKKYLFIFQEKQNYSTIHIKIYSPLITGYIIYLKFY